MHFELKTLYHRHIDKVRDAAHHRGQRAQAMCHQMQKVGVVHAPRANPGHAGQGTCFLCVTGDTNNERQSGRKIKQPTPERVAQRVKADWGQMRDRRERRQGNMAWLRYSHDRCQLWRRMLQVVHGGAMAVSQCCCYHAT